MATRTRTPHQPGLDGSDLPEQLALLPISEVPLQFRLDERTRRRGLEHIAEIRRMLEQHSSEQHSSERHEIVSPTTPERDAAPARRAA